ncbi:hypothetical protein KIPB_014474, partial [Kipferlia bialata]
NPLVSLSDLSTVAPYRYLRQLNISGCPLLEGRTEGESITAKKAAVEYVRQNMPRI